MSGATETVASLANGTYGERKTSAKMQNKRSLHRVEMSKLIPRKRDE